MNYHPLFDKIRIMEENHNLDRIIQVMNRLREVMNDKGITQMELAQKTGIKQPEISLIVNDKKPNLSLSVAKRIAKVLGKSVDYLWPG